ncbi:DUF6890 family protein [Serratia sp. root2]|uniref:DUF6890 family protein n=1 Tax=Serratia sp. root2 TaxID=3059676 RepID=UPI003FA72106
MRERVKAIESNELEQLFALRRHYLPQEADDEESLARAIWLDNRHWKYMGIAVNNGIAQAFKGE